MGEWGERLLLRYLLTQIDNDKMNTLFYLSIDRQYTLLSVYKNHQKNIEKNYFLTGKP